MDDFFVESAYFLLQLINTGLVLLLELLHLSVLEFEEGLRVLLLAVTFLPGAELVEGKFVDLKSLFFGEVVLDEVDFLGLDHVLLIRFLIQDIYLLDELLDFNLVVFKFAVGVVDELVLLSLDLL